MYSALSPGAIGVSAPTIEAAIGAAKKGGFQGVEVNAAEVADRVLKHGIPSITDLFEKSGIRPAGWGLPTRWRSNPDELEEDLVHLAQMAAACAAIGCNRTFTWIMPASNERDYEENLAHHIAQLRPVANILESNGCRIGLEFIGPKTSRQGAKHEFIYQLRPMLEMAREIGSNCGLLLDSWHWYTSEGTADDLRSLSARDVVYVHVNDAPTGKQVHEQIDNRREIPGATGVIPISEFMQALSDIGYDGPVVPEPFKQELNDLGSDDERLRTVGDSMNRIWKWNIS